MIKLRNKNVIYTAIFGDYNGLISQPKLKGFDFICFTDNADLKAYPWKTIKVEMPVENDYTRSNRYIKLLPHKFLSEYDLSIYIDGNIWIRGDLNKMVDKHLGSNSMAAFSHLYTTPDSRDCIYEEFEAIMQIQESGKFIDDEITMKKQIDLLKSEGYPLQNGLIKGTCLVRLHNQPEVIKTMEDWWCMVENYSRRDQLSFNYVAWKNEFEYSTIPGDLRFGNPYIYWLGKHRKDWKAKLLKTKLKKFFKLI